MSAWGYGIGSCWIGDINREIIYKYFNIPHTLKIVAIVALGYHDEENTYKVKPSIKNLLPYKEGNKIIVPKRKLDNILHLENYY